MGHLLAGLGRRLANEVCWTARLSPFASTAKLTDEEVERLVEAIATCVARRPAPRAGPTRHELVDRAADNTTSKFLK